MIITNKYNLPEALIDLIKSNINEPSNDSYGVTTLLNSTRCVLLEKRHFNETEVDASDLINVTLGTALHNAIEKFDKSDWSEKSLKFGKLKGRIDLYNPETFELIDYKTASCRKILNNDFEDWKLQGLMYAYLLKQSNYYVNKLKFIAILKDWTKYSPLESSIYIWEYKILPNDLNDIQDFINNKIDKFEYYKNLSDDELPDCENTWYTGDKYAVYKKSGQVRADRVLDTEQEAHDYITNKLNGVGIIEIRKGEYLKCKNYCSVNKWCKYYKERM